MWSFVMGEESKSSVRLSRERQVRKSPDFEASERWGRGRETLDTVHWKVVEDRRLKITKSPLVGIQHQNKRGVVFSRVQLSLNYKRLHPPISP